MIRKMSIFLFGIMFGSCAHSTSDVTLTTLPTNEPAALERNYIVRLVQVPMPPQSNNDRASIKEKIRELRGELREKHKIIITVLGIGKDHIMMQIRSIEDFEQPIPMVEVQSIRKSLYDYVGKEFPLELSVQECCKEPTLTGKIKVIEKERVLIVNEDKKNGNTDDPEATWVSLEDKGKITFEGSKEMLTFNKLVAGMQVNVWSTGLMMLSYPGQTSALKMEVMEGKKEAALPAAGLFATVLEVTREEDHIALDFSLRNVSDQDQDISFGSGQQYDISVLNEQGVEVYRFSKGVSFTMAIIDMTINKADKLTFKKKWNLRDNEDQLVPKGRYTVKVWMMSVIKADGYMKKINPDELVATATVDVSYDD